MRCFLRAQMHLRGGALYAELLMRAEQILVDAARFRGGC